ncbi:hypothetical protein PDESU_05774 [Pontiella desulfatans]|uniref:PKD domain-containing protein n=1 Tax=Pontiella desulfatans TaxID=2750659 RepID=A0A6C2UB62_PONDE|nr:hypothetical protein PDESU_05774 [Pontiella desulfatans]
MRTTKRFLGRLIHIVMVALVMMPSLAALAAPEAICVPWKSDESLPHWTYDGAAITLKGIARGDAVEYKWDYGDGSGDTGWMTIANPYNLGVQHVYTGVPNQLFIATLTVRNGLGEENSDTYPIRMFVSTNLRNNDHLEVRRNMAIDAGLWWLHTRLNRTTYAAGSPGFGQPVGYWQPSYYPLAATGSGIEAFQLSGHTVLSDYDHDPYTETVQRAMNYLLYNIRTYAIGPQPAGDPDTNGNGIGLVANNESTARQTYIGGICMAALASSGAPNVVAQVGSVNVVGRTYADIVQDMVDFFAYGQVDSGWGRGGWRYYANYTESDMSTSQWPALGMLAAERNMHSIVPAFVRAELPIWMNTSQNLAAGNNHGAFAYYYPGYYPYYNITKQGAGLICYEFLYLSPSATQVEYDAKLAAFLADTRVQAGIGFIYRHWNDTGTGWDYTKLHGNSYGMYGLQKAMRITDPAMADVTEFDYTAGTQTANTFDWFYWPEGQANQGIGYYTVVTQQGDGSWDDTIGPNAVYDEFATAWRILVLSPRVTLRPPVAVVCNCDKQEYNLNQTIQLDGSCSYHTDVKRSLVQYEWDFDYDGTFVADASGITAEIPGGYAVPGIYPVALRVTDDTPSGALTDIAICEIDVHEPPHCPHAYAGGPYVGFVGTPVQFDATRSWDPDAAEFPYLGDPLEFSLIEWDLDNDGLFGADDLDCFGIGSDAFGNQPQWVWHAPYEGIIGLRVTDTGIADNGEIFEICQDLDFTEIKIGNHRPIADAGGHYMVPTNTCFELDGSGSFDIDPGDYIASYAWDLDSDGVFDDSSETNPTFCVSGELGKVYDIALKVTDSFGETAVDHTTVTIISNQAPVALCTDVVVGTDAGTCSANASIDDGSFDPDGDAIIIEQIPAGPYPLGDTQVTLLVTDDGGFSDWCIATVTVEDRTPPEILDAAAAPNPAMAGDTVSFTVDATNACDALLDVVWDFGDGSPPTTDTAHAYAADGTYKAIVTVTDDAGNSASAPVTVVVGDSLTGFVFGWGCIDSPKGAYRANASIHGEARFVVYAKYRDGNPDPTGRSGFNLQAGSLKFMSTGYEALVVSPDGKNAQISGEGWANGKFGYKFRIYMHDGVDAFRIRIWKENALGVEIPIYDNGSKLPIWKGSIVISKQNDPANWWLEL